MMLAEAEITRRKITDVLASREAGQLIARSNMKDVERDRELANMLDEPFLQYAISFNDHADWVPKVNCYGLAVGTPKDWNDTPDGGWFLMWGGLSEKFSTYFDTALPENQQTIYRILRDGMQPVSAADADSLPAQHRIFVGCGMHFFARIKPGLWVHKAGKNYVRLGFGSQPVITNIHQTLIEYMQTSKRAETFYGFYEVPTNRISLNSKLPPAYGEKTIRAIKNIIEPFVVNGVHRIVGIVADEMAALDIYDHPQIRFLFRARAHLDKLKAGS